MNSVRRTEQDWVLIGLAFLASILGLVAIATANLVEDATLIQGIPVEAIKQSGLLVAGLIAFVAARFIPGWVMKLILMAAYALALLGLIATFGPLGVEKNGQKLWLELWGGIPLQPSEFLKAAAILLAGILFATRGPEPVCRTPQTIGEIVRFFLSPKLAHAAPFLVGFGAAFAVILQKDMGTAAVIVMAVLGMHFVSGASLKRVGLIVAGLALAGAVFFFESDYRAERFPNWLNRWEKGYRTDGGFQQTVSEIGFFRGGLMGVGLTRGQAKNDLPVGTSDFVLTTVGEETGIWGVGLILGTLVTLSLLMMLRTQEGAGVATYAWTGMGIWLLSQTIVNFGMANALLPPIGLPLPFISTGGSTLVAIWAALGALMTLSSLPIPERKAQPAAKPARDWTRRRPERSAPTGSVITRPYRRQGHETRTDRRGYGRPRVSRP